MGYLNLGSFLFLYSQGSSIVLLSNFSKKVLHTSIVSKAILPTKNCSRFFLEFLNESSVPQSTPSKSFFIFLVNQPYKIFPSWFLRVVLNLMNFAFFSSTTVPSGNLLCPAPLKYSMLLTTKTSSISLIVQSAIAQRFVKLLLFTMPSDFGVFVISQVIPMKLPVVSFLRKTP